MLWLFGQSFYLTSRAMNYEMSVKAFHSAMPSTVPEPAARGVPPALAIGNAQRRQTT